MAATYKDRNGLAPMHRGNAGVHGLGRRPEPEFVPDVAAIEAWQRRQERTRVAYAAHLVFVAREDAYREEKDRAEDAVPEWSGKAALMDPKDGS